MAIRHLKWFCILLLSGYVFCGNAQQIKTIDDIQDSIVKQLHLFPQEKIHLHTDRDVYVSGEKIWFKAYVVDALNHESPTYSRYVYIELMNSSDSLVQRVMLCPDENGLFHGNLFLSELMPEGDYTLRAYTRYMEDPGDDYFFKKPIRISNFNLEKKQTRKQSKITYDVSFYPEGGYMVEGAICKVAYKALNKNGISEFITGEIVDKEENVISEVSTVFAGMGLFTIIPEAGKTYFLRCKNQSGQEKRFQLPAAQKTYSIAINHRNKRFFTEVRKSPSMPEKPLYLLIHCRGMVLYFELWNDQQSPVVLPDNLFPSGVTQFVLLDEQMNPISERLVFVKNNDQAQLTFSTDQPSYKKRDKVTSNIQITDSEGNPLTGHISVAITDDKDIAVDTLHTILSSLLLSSELKGYIESPGFYLQDHTQAKYALDLLMLTHGWRRYDIPETLKGNYKLPTTTFEIQKEISGSVKSLFLGKPVTNGEIILFTSNGDFGQLETDSAGFFSLYAHYPDSITFILQAKNQKGKSNVELSLNQETFPVL